MNAFSRRASIFVASALASTTLFACSVPVFRYALDHWRPDGYQVFVYHDGEWSEDDEALLRRIRERAEKQGANVEAHAIDLGSDPVGADLARWERVTKREGGEPDLPQMVVNLPAAIAGGEAIVGAASWEASEVEGLMGSPVREEIGERLLAGDVVWVYLESGDAADDEIRFGLLEAELAKQQETLELPEIDPNDLEEMTSEPEELAIRFSAIRVDRNDPAEKWFTEMLLSTEPDLRNEELVSQPMVFPVFGRGRALYALVGDGINPDVIEEAAVFLTGACQCTVKAENPGVDLLIPVRWDDFVETPEPEDFDLPLVGLAGSEPEARLASAARGQAAGGENSTVGEGANAGDGAAGQYDEGHVASDRGGSSGLARTGATDWLRWLPWGVLLAVGLIAFISGATILRRQENR